MEATITAKELKLRLGQYLTAVACGKTIRVTKRGKVVIELCQPALTAKDKLDRLVAQGRARPGNGKRLGPVIPSISERSTTEIIRADRDDERW